MAEALIIDAVRTPMGRYRGALAGVDPAFMGLGPVPAIRRALGAARLELDEIDLIEVNEAFAAQVLACARELGIDGGRRTSTAARSRSATRSAARARGC